MLGGSSRTVTTTTFCRRLAIAQQRLSSQQVRYAAGMPMICHNTTISRYLYVYCKYHRNYAASFGNRQLIYCTKRTKSIESFVKSKNSVRTLVPVQLVPRQYNVVPAIVWGCYYWICNNSNRNTSTTETTLCDSDHDKLQSTLTVAVAETRKNSPLVEKLSLAAKTIHRSWKLLRRIVKLAFTLSPMILFYPVYLLASAYANDEPASPKDAHEIAVSNMLNDSDDDVRGGITGWYYRLCLQCVEWSGACLIKCMQWAGSRPDLFGHDFCTVFSKLQDNTNPHSWRYTEHLLKESYGRDWNERIRIPNKQQDLLGSGCVGQVYRGQILLNTDDVQGGVWQDVAIKVLHPHVQADVEADLDLMRVAVKFIGYLPGDVFQKLKWLNLAGIVEELARLLELQMDLRHEARNIRILQENFKDNPRIVFPKLFTPSDIGCTNTSATDSYFEPTKSVLIEEFCVGIPIVQFCRQNYQTRPAVLSELCHIAIAAVCKMIFLDNFVHGDLHPGNVFVSPDGTTFILFDAGIVNEYSDSDHQTIVDVLASFIRKDGRRAGRLMIDDSNERLSESTTPNEKAFDEELFIDKIEALTIRASTDGYLMEHLGTYITYICNAASHHHVMLNPAFISAALAVKVQEGIALAMDPSVEIPNIAIPIIIQSEGRRIVNKVSSSFRLFHVPIPTIFETEERRKFLNSASLTARRFHDALFGPSEK